MFDLKVLNFKTSHYLGTLFSQRFKTSLFIESDIPLDQVKNLS